MNNTTIAFGKLLEEINEEKARLLMPAIIYVSVLMANGLLGNIMVCFYYSVKTKTTPSTIFIVCLAIYDLTVCCIFMPTEIVDIVKFYTFDNSIACKVLRFVNFFTGMGSVLTLLAIAVDRYKHIPRSADKQLTLTQAKLICVVIAVTAVALSWPSILIYNTLPINIPNKYGLNLNGSNCMLTDEQVYRPYVWAFNAVQFICFIILTTVLTVLYGIIGHTIYKHRKRMSRYKLYGLGNRKQEQASQSETTTNNSSPGNYVNTQENENNGEQTNSRTERSSRVTRQEFSINLSSTSSLENISSVVSTEDEERHFDLDTDNTCYQGNKHTDQRISEVTSDSDDTQQNAGTTNMSVDVIIDQPKTNQPVSKRGQRLHGRMLTFDRDTIQITLVMIAVTGLFIISMLPYLCLTVWRIYEGKHEDEFLSDQGLLAFKIVSRSYLLNSSLNPWIYGVFNRKFRKYYYSVFCCKLK